jgi:hypothetical protein
LLRLAARSPRTLVHGDFRLDNLFCRRDRGAHTGADDDDDDDDGSADARGYGKTAAAAAAAASEWRAIDWQFVGQQRGATDLAYRLRCCLIATIRRTLD